MRRKKQTNSTHQNHSLVFFFFSSQTSSCDVIMSDGARTGEKRRDVTDGDGNHRKQSSKTRLLNMQTVTDWKVKNREYHKIVNTSTALETVPKAHRKKNQNKTKHFLFFCFLTGFDPEKKRKENLAKYIS